MGILSLTRTQATAFLKPQSKERVREIEKDKYKKTDRMCGAAETPATRKSNNVDDDVKFLFQSKLRLVSDLNVNMTAS